MAVLRLRRRNHKPYDARRKSPFGVSSAAAFSTRQDCRCEADTKLLKKRGFAPDALVTDKLGSYAAAKS
jgi:hypothetical protein